MEVRVKITLEVNHTIDVRDLEIGEIEVIEDQPPMEPQGLQGREEKTPDL